MVHGQVLFNSRGLQETREEGLDALPQHFLLRDPVALSATIDKPKTDDSNALLVVVNGKVVQDSSQGVNDPIILKAGENVANDLILLISNGKTYHNGHTWERTEGWSYNIKVTAPNGEDSKPFEASFGDSEPVPFKDGPHHG